MDHTSRDTVDWGVKYLAAIKWVIYTLWKISFFDNTDMFFCALQLPLLKKITHMAKQWHTLVRLSQGEPKVQASLNYKVRFEPVRLPQ